MQTISNRRQSGMTLTAMVVSMGLSVIMLTALGGMFFFSARSFVGLDNVITMETENRIAIAELCKDIRQADKIVNFQTDQLIYESGTNRVLVMYMPKQKQILQSTKPMDTNIVAKVTNKYLVDGVDWFKIDVMQRIPGTDGDYALEPATSPENCKVVRFQWESSRDVLGQKASSSTVKSAHVVLRNLNP